MSFALNKQNLYLYLTAWVYKNRFVTARQVYRRFQSYLSQRTCYNLLSDLCLLGLVTKDKSRQTKKAAHVPFFYFATAKAAIFLHNSSQFSSLLGFKPERKRKRGLSGDPIDHELNLTEVLLNAELSVISLNKNFGLNATDGFKWYYERDGRGDTTITTPDLNDPKKHLILEPDSTAVLVFPEGRIEPFEIELDNGSMRNPKKMRHKYVTYKAYATQNGFQQKFLKLNQRHRIGLSVPEKIGFRVLTVTTSITGEQTEEERRNELFRYALELESYSQFLFTTLYEATRPAQFFDSIWIRGFEYVGLAGKPQRVLDRKTSHFKLTPLNPLVLDRMPRQFIIENQSVENKIENRKDFDDLEFKPQAMQPLVDQQGRLL